MKLLLLKTNNEEAQTYTTQCKRQCYGGELGKCCRIAKAYFYSNFMTTIEDPTIKK